MRIIRQKFLRENCSKEKFTTRLSPRFGTITSSFGSQKLRPSDLKIIEEKLSQGVQQNCTLRENYLKEKFTTRLLSRFGIITSSFGSQKLRLPNLKIIGVV